MTKIAAVQMISAPTVPENLVSARRLITQAAEQGAKLVLLPEYWAALESRDAEKIGHAEPAGVQQRMETGQYPRSIRNVMQHHRRIDQVVAVFVV